MPTGLDIFIDTLFAVCSHFQQRSSKHKLACTMRQYDVSPARVINVDGTCVRLLPANTNGWSQAESKASQICSPKAAITGTLAVPMDATAPIYLQLIFEGKTNACRPSQDGISEQVSGEPLCVSTKHIVKAP